MSALAETQHRLRTAIVSADAGGHMPQLIGGSNPARRLAIHRRHYEASLVDALMNKFPATSWLMGSEFVADAARSYVHRHPPAAPCIAEYGMEFPAHLAAQPGVDRSPFLCSFATLEWHLGWVSVAVGHEPIGMDSFAGIAADFLPDLRLQLQPGLQYLTAQWPVDDLISLYLTDRQPESYTIEASEISLEIHGARGKFHVIRLDPATIVFRSAIKEGKTIEAAAELAMHAEPAFDIGHALGRLVVDRLVVAIDFPRRGASS